MKHIIALCVGLAVIAVANCDVFYEENFKNGELSSKDLRYLLSKGCDDIFHVS